MSPASEEQKSKEQERGLPVRAANLPVVNEEDASPQVNVLYERFRENFGRPQVPGILKCFATHPPLLEHMMGLAQSMLFTEGALGRKNKEMIATFVSAKNGCAYCADSHGFALRTYGGSAGLLAATMACDLQSESVDAAQVSLLMFAQKVTEDSKSVEAADVERLREFGWTELQIAETIHVAALFACFNRVVNGFGLPSQDLLAGFAEAASLEGIAS